MDIIKYFFEEPAALEPLTPDDHADARRQHGPTRSLEAFLNAPRYYRGYLAGSDLTHDRIGATALQNPTAFAEPLCHLLRAAYWYQVRANGLVQALPTHAAGAAFAAPDELALLANSPVELTPDDLRPLAQAERRHALPDLRLLLDRGVVVCFTEPAHDGFDWSLFAAQPLRDQLVQAFRAHPAPPGVRRFVVPFRRARSEEKFYFERWQLDALPSHIEEV